MRVLMLIPLLAACQMAEPQPDFRPVTEDSCGAGGYQWLVGKSLAAVTLPSDLNARVVEHGMAITMEYIGERLTISLDDTGRVDRVTCG